MHQVQKPLQNQPQDRLRRPDSPSTQPPTIKNREICRKISPPIGIEPLNDFKQLKRNIFRVPPDNYLNKNSGNFHQFITKAPELYPTAKKSGGEP